MNCVLKMPTKPTRDLLKLIFLPSPPPECLFSLFGGFSLDRLPQQFENSMPQGQGCMGGERRRLLNQFAPEIKKWNLPS